MPENIESRLAAMEGLMRENNDRQREMLILLQGNSINKADDGLVGDIVQMKRDMATFKKQRITVLAWLTGASVGSGYATFKAFYDFFKH